MPTEEETRNQNNWLRHYLIGTPLWQNMATVADGVSKQLAIPVSNGKASLNAKKGPCPRKEEKISLTKERKKNTKGRIIKYSVADWTSRISQWTTLREKFFLLDQVYEREEKRNQKNESTTRGRSERHRKVETQMA